MENEAGEPIGFALWLKDYNQALVKANGRLFPFGLLKVLRRAKSIDLKRLNIDPKNVEFGWILEHNYAMRKPIEKLGSNVYKRYRMYDRDLESGV